MPGADGGIAQPAGPASRQPAKHRLIASGTTGQRLSHRQPSTPWSPGQSRHASYRWYAFPPPQWPNIQPPLTSAVLPLHPNGLVAFLEEASLVHRQNCGSAARGRIRQWLAPVDPPSLRASPFPGHRCARSTGVMALESKCLIPRLPVRGGCRALPDHWQARGQLPSLQPPLLMRPCINAMGQSAGTPESVFLRKSTLNAN